MQPRQIIAAGAAVAVIILIAVVARRSAARARTASIEGFTTGMWVGDRGFLDKAELSDMQLYLGAPEQGTRKGYLIMTDKNGEFVANTSFQCEDDGMRCDAAASAADADLEITFDAAAPLPSELKLNVSVKDGTLTLYDDKNVVAFLYKDSAASHAAATAEAAPLAVLDSSD